MATQRGKIRIGTSGYQYDHWRGVLYPQESAKKQWFEIYSTSFDTVEINNTFYHLPAAETFDRWREAAPSGFLFVLKFSRYGSHMKCLKDPEDTISRFMERAERLGEHLGPILVQLKPNWERDTGRLDAFLGAAAARRQRWAVEFRHRSWLCEEVFDVLRRHGAALCIHDMIDDHPRETTADWTYLRFHGNRYEGCYSAQFLSATADRIEEHIAGGLDVCAYFNNDAEGHAVRNARDLRRYLRNRGTG